MKLFGKGITEDTHEADGKVNVRIVVDRIDRKTNKVKAFIIERTTGKAVFKLRYTTVEKSEVRCYSEAESYLLQFCEENDFIVGDIGTNVKLPFVKTLEDKSGYGRR